MSITQEQLWHLPEGLDYTVRYIRDVSATGWVYHDQFDSLSKDYLYVVSKDKAAEWFEKLSEDGVLVVQLVRMSRYFAGGKMVVMEILRHKVKMPD